ncbi:hypothetical protein NKI54_24280 [Mesorhizobium sp. M0663]|uniref:hypothetical protein n=1 Tax=Mesorhizobium sp. M0663 TaxID=2956981 RepID=UPI00333A9F16
MVPVTTDTSESALSLLMDRLSWPVKMVRWRTAKAIRRLLEQESTREKATRALLDWMATRDLESEVCSALSLLTVVNETARPNLRDVAACVKRPSILSDILLEVAYGWSLGGWDEGLRPDVPEYFEPSEYFEQHKTAHVPPILLNSLSKLEAKSGKPFKRQWAYEWHVMREETGILFTQYPYYFGDFALARSGIHGQFLQRQSELYRSAYLRVLAYAVAAWDMPVRLATQYCLDVLPAVPRLFEVEPQPRPKWVADFPAKLHDPSADFQKLGRALVKAGVSKSRVAVSLDVPLPKEIAEFGAVSATAYLCSADFEPAEDFDPFLPETLVFSHDVGLGDDISFRDFEDVRVDGKVGWCAPVSTHLIPMPSGLWHDEYIGAGMAIPAAYCFDSTPRLSADDRGLALFIGKDVVATTSFWHDDWTPLVPKKGATRVGVVSCINRRLLKKTLQRFEARLGWFVRLSALEGERIYGDLKPREQLTFFLDTNELGP